MKRILILTLALALPLVACNKIESENPIDEMGTIFVSLDQSAVTKAAATTGEKAVSSATVFVFNGDVLVTSAAFTAGEIAGGKSININAGTYNVRVLCNTTAPVVNTRTAYEATNIDFVANSAGKFVMEGNNNVTVTANGNANCAVQLNRLVGRIRLVSVTGATPNHAFVSTIPKFVKITGTAVSSATQWYNLAGRKAGGFITSANADNSALTYHDYAANSLFYSNPNSSTVAPGGSASTEGKTVLSINATWNGNVYWYPIVIDQIVRNTNYDVTLTISGPGNPGNDPNGPYTPIQKGNLTVTITATDWEDGTSYTENI